MTGRVMRPSVTRPRLPPAANSCRTANGPLGVRQVVAAGGSPRSGTVVKVTTAAPSRIITRMCGFAGVVAWDDRYRVSRETLGRMSAAVAHRGPDGEGSHINHDGEVTPQRPQVALAFR